MSDLPTLLQKNAALFTAYEEWTNAQNLLITGSIDDADSFNASGGKSGALGYYPVENISGQTIYVPCFARLNAIAAGATDRIVLENLLAMQVGAARQASNAATAAAQTATVAVERFTDQRPAGFSIRSGVAAATVDAEKKKLRWIDRAGIGWSAITERFTRDVEFRAKATFTTGADFNNQRLVNLAAPVADTDAINLATLRTVEAGVAATIEDLSEQIGNAQSPGVERLERTLPAGFTARSGVASATIDAQNKKLRWIDRAGIGWSAIAERFTRDVEFRAKATFTQIQRGGERTGYPIGYDRSGWAVATLDSARKVLFGLRGSSAYAYGRRLAFADEVQAVTPSADYVPPALLPRITNTAIVYGDSLTAGAGGSGTRWSDVMTAAIGGGFTSTIRAIGGQKSFQIAMRMGAYPIFLTVEGNKIPAGAGAVRVTTINGQATGVQGGTTGDKRFLSTVADTTTRNMSGHLAGRPVTVRRTVDAQLNEVYEIITTSTNTAFACPPDSVFVPSDVADLRDKEVWVCLGTNDRFDTGGLAVSVVCRPPCYCGRLFL